TSRRSLAGLRQSRGGRWRPAWRDSWGIVLPVSGGGGGGEHDAGERVADADARARSQDENGQQESGVHGVPSRNRMGYCCSASWVTRSYSLACSGSNGLYAVV